MTVLLTGAAGFLGRRIAGSLLAAGVQDLRIHVRRTAPPGLLEGLQRDYPDANVSVVAANLLHRHDLAPMLEGVDVLVHAAAGMRGSAADMFANTVVGTRNLLDAAAAAHVRRVVMVSSFAVYQTASLPTGAAHDETVPVEPIGIDKGPYAHAKTRQEHLLDEYRERYGFETVVLRPGVIYGPGGGAFSNRVGIGAMGLFFSLGGRAPLPLTYVDNCADAIACAALSGADGQAYNVVDDDIPTCSQYLRAYRRQVARLRVLPVPYPVFMLGAKILLRYHRWSKGQLPAVFTPYVVRSMYRRFEYPNGKLKAIGWQQRVPTDIGLERAFEDLAKRAG